MASDVEVMQEANALIVGGDKPDWRGAYKVIVEKYLGQAVKTLPDAAVCEKQVRGLFFRLLREKKHLLAAALNWPSHVFDARPHFTRRAFEALTKKGQLKTKFFGATSSSKTYAALAWHYLEFCRDPMYTQVLLIAINEEHLKKNAFAQVKTLHELSAFKVAGVKSSTLYLGYPNRVGVSGFSALLVPQSSVGTGRLRGYKPKARSKKDDEFGPQSRVFILVDETQDVSDGLFDDYGSVESSATEWDNVKIVECGNPTTLQCRFVRDSEPEGGWKPDEQLDGLKEWTLADGTLVVRFDAADCENVQERRLVYPGLQTWETYSKNLAKGSDSFEYLVNSRGFPPTRADSLIAIPPALLTEQRGEPDFVNAPMKILSVDLAYHGEDETIATLARWGMARGVRRAMRGGEVEMFIDPLSGEKMNRLVCVIDQQFALGSDSDPIRKAREITKLCRLHGVRSGNVVMDCSGPGGAGVAECMALRHDGKTTDESIQFGEVVRMTWNTAATEIPFTNCSPTPAREVCKLLVTELWIATREWLLTGSLWFGPAVEERELFQQLSTRRMDYEEGKRRIESKGRYKTRGNPSPDRADSMVMVPHFLRLTQPELPGRLAHKDKMKTMQVHASEWEDENVDTNLHRPLQVDGIVFTTPAGQWQT